MPQNNLRIISNNAADRATITADTTSGGLTTANLKIDRKADVHRATAKTVAYRAVWANLEAIGGAFLVNTNHTDAATMRFRGTKELPKTNMLSYTEDFTNSYWVKSAGGTGSAPTVTANAGAAPDGTMTADSVVFQAGSGTTINDKSVLYTAPAGVAIGQTYTSSIFLKGTAGQQLLIRGVAGVAYTIFTLDGTWQRFWTVETAASSNFEVGIRQGVVGTINSNVTVLVWGAQMELSALSSYYPSLSSGTAARPLGYIDSWQSYDYDSAWNIACPGGGATLRNWSNTPVGANAYAYGGGATARHWLTTPDSFYGIAIDISDPTNASNLEASRMVLGPYWSPKYNAEYGMGLSPLSRGTQRYNDAGDLVSIRGTKSRELTVSLAGMPQTDVDALWDILWENGCEIPILCSVFPNDASGKQERRNQIYGKLPTLSPLTMQFVNQFSNSLKLTEA